ncbi:SDR family oxidoreductase [Brevibacterium jeotgali]|uniref:3-oxoacyl-[acyl-carrier protein] reductase n=1 Tax=Brevibacterium jeotgali TaxID=1262550 RepID=A0A2H1L9G3_9MICO|nr:SDR family oxidoreductase [Brevibacterium jeotgali]TWC01585.1 3-oxoacyl-[acyl-carrier protein] reductase [Brevibacterium jeotgali]SMY13103.1 3-oxoacyl-[acyl-carrier protein] reductase [Brevibacterium jeotgali]
MDLGIAGRRAVVCASSAGLGRACATELARAGAIVILNGRRADALEATARDIRDETGADVRTVVGSVADLDVQEALVAAADGAVDILVNNNGGPPFRAFTDVDDDDIRAGVENNMVTPIALARRVLGGMVERRFGRIVNITSASVKMPIAGLDVSSGARAGLTGFLAGVARDVAHANVTINFLLPGSFDTDRLQSGQSLTAEASGRSIDEVRGTAAASIPTKRFGEPDEFGAACAFLASDRAGYITGQSLLIDGGAYRGIL